MKLSFVVQRADGGTFWSDEGWVYSIDNATPYDNEQEATDFAADLVDELRESMRVILQGPRLVATLSPPETEKP